MREFNYTQATNQVMIDGHVCTLKPATLELLENLTQIRDTAENDQISNLKAQYSAVVAMLGAEAAEIALGAEATCDLHKLQALFEFLVAEITNESAD